MTTARPLRLVRWTGVQARALTAIARHGCGRAFTPAAGINGDGDRGPWNFRIWPSCPRDIRSPPSGPVQSDNSRPEAGRFVGLDWNGARLWLRLPPRVCDDWLAMRAPDLDIGELPEQFIDAAWEAMVADAVNALGIAMLCPGMRVVKDETPRSQAAYPHAWTVSIRSSGRPGEIKAELAADDAGLQCLADLLSRMPVQADADGPAAFTTLPIVISARAGEATLTAADMRGLEVGDVVLFDWSLASLDGDAWLATQDGQGVRVRACEPGASRYVVTQEWSLLMNDDGPRPAEIRPELRDRQLEGNDIEPDSADMPRYGESPSQSADMWYGNSPSQSTDMPDRDSPSELTDMLDRDSPSQPADMRRHGDSASPRHVYEPADKDGGLDVDRIPVRLVFDLGEHSLTLGDLRRLRRGEFFDLQRRIDAGPVHMRVNGTLIGTAELVDIDGRIGARVLALIPGSAACG